MLKLIVWFVGCGGAAAGDQLIQRYRPGLKWWYRGVIGGLMGVLFCKFWVSFRTFPASTSMGEINALARETGKIVLYRIV